MTLRTVKRGARFLPFLAIGIVLLYSVGIFVQQKQPLMVGASDFSCFYSAGRMVVTGNGSRIYDYDAQSEAQRPFFGIVGTHRFVLPFIFLPFVLVIFAPLALFSYPHALALWFALNVCLLISIPFLLRRRLNLSDSHLALALLVMAFFLPCSISLAQGQPTILVLVLFTLAFLDLDEGHDSHAGCVLALTIFKPQFALPLLLALAITRRWKSLAGFFGTCAFLFGISVALVGWTTTLSFPRAVAAFNASPSSRGGEYNPAGMSNLRGLMLSLFNSRTPHDLIVAFVIALSVLLVGAVLVTVLTHGRGISDLDFSLIVVITLLASYHSYGHDLILLILPLFLVVNYVGRQEFSHFRLILGMIAGLLFILPSLVFPPPVMVVAVLLFLVALLKESLYPGTPIPVRQLPEATPNLRARVASGD
jgi:hypothetical protein